MGNVAPSTLSNREIHALLKQGMMLDRVEEALPDLEVVRQSVQLQSDAAELYADVAAAQPIERKRAQTVMNALHKAYAQAGEKEELPALNLLMRDMGLKVPTRIKSTSVSMRNIGTDFIDGAVVGIIATDMGAGQKTLFGKVTMCVIGAVVGLASIKMSHALLNQLWGHKEAGTGR